MQIRIAQKGAKDPVQQNLRNLKKEWNKQVKMLIAQLIAFKRGINGYGDPKAGLPPSDIKNPLPHEVAQYLLEMTTRYNDVANMAGTIISSQEDYSNNRRKSQKEANISNEIVKEASILSRWWTWAKQYPLFSTDELTKDRLSLMNISSDISERLNDVEAILVGTGGNQIYNAYNEYKKALSLIESIFIKKFIEVVKAQVESTELKKQLLKKMKDTELPAEIQQAEESLNQTNSQINTLEAASEIATFIDTIADSFRVVLGELKKNNKVSHDSYETFKKLLISLKQKESEYTKNKTEDNFKIMVGAYNSIKDYVKSISSTLLGKDVDSYEQAINELSALACNDNNELVVIASKQITRWLNRMRLGLFSNDVDRLRLDIGKSLNKASVKLMDISNILEENNEALQEVINDVAELCMILADIAYNFIRAAEVHNSEYYVSKGGDKKLYKIENTSIMERYNKKFLEAATEFTNLANKGTDE